MKFAGRIGLVVTLAFTAGTFAEDSIPTSAEIRQVVARADTSSVRPAIVTGTIPLDDFAGRYDTAAGATVFVSRDGESLALEVSDSAPPTNLVQLDARTFASGDDSVIVSFQMDAAGRVNGLVLSTVSTESTLAARAAARRGIVTIHDETPRRGIVTIHDVYEEVARL
jgi:hypothetical protein